MMTRPLPIDLYDFTHRDELLVDTNIWLDIHGPQGTANNPRTRTYSRALARILRAKSRMYVDVLILTEFANRYARLEWQWWSKRTGTQSDFKAFRRGTEFPRVAKGIADALRRILKDAARIGNGFEAVDMEALLSDFEANSRDFNDAILAQLCRAKDLKLVTHDGDFKDCGITILTANSNLLSS